MLRTSTLAIIALLGSSTARSQSADLVFFTDDGSKFTLLVDGDEKNKKPASRVIAQGIRNESPVIMIRFEDPAIPQLRKPGYFPLGKEYTVMVTTNKKGEKVLRSTGEAELGTAVRSDPELSRPTGFVDDPTPSRTSGSSQLSEADDDHQVTTITTIEETQSAGNGEDVRIDMSVNGVNLNMGVQVDDGMEGTGTMTTTTTTTTRTSSSSTSSKNGTNLTAAPVAAKEPDGYRMPGYTGPIGCAMPMSGSEFTDAKKSIEAQDFEDTKMTMAKQIGRDRCFTADQVRSMMSAFDFEDSRLDFAKFAYDRTHDIGNFYKVNDAFDFSSSVDELNDYIGSR